MTKAFAQNGIVTDIARVDPFTIFQPAYASLFVDAPDDVQPGWLYDGSTFTAPPVQPATVPQSVTMRQARLALLAVGKLDTINTVIAGIEPAAQRQAIQIEWEYAQTVDRNSPWVAGLAPALALSEADLDSLFVFAAQQ
jgi:hypothetical protein